MKTSNILLTGLLGSITATTMAMMIDIRFGGHTPEYTEYEQEDVGLPSFTHLRVHDNDRSVIVEASASRSIRLFTMKGNQMPSVTFHVQGDTLVIDQFDNHGLAGASFTLQVPHNDLRGISAHNTEIVLNDYPFESMSLELDHSRVQVYPRNRNTARQLLVSAVNHSHVNVALPVDTLTLSLDESSVVVDDDVTLLSGSMENSSSLGIRNVKVFDFSKDGSSRLDHWN